MQAVATRDETVILPLQSEWLKLQRFLGYLMTAIIWIDFVISLWLIFMGWHHHQVVLATLGTTSACLFPAIAKLLKFILGQVKSGTKIVLAPEGLYFDRFATIGAIPWDEITSVTVTGGGIAPMVLVVPRDIDSLRMRFGKVNKYQWFYETLGGGFSVAAAPFGLTTQEMVDRIEQYRLRQIDNRSQENV